jgi:hypothetical protein
VGDLDSDRYRASVGHRARALTIHPHAASVCRQQGRLPDTRGPAERPLSLLGGVAGGERGIVSAVPFPVD